MRRVPLVVTVAVFLAFGANPAFGAADEHSNCLAEANSTANPGAVGSDARSFAQNGSEFGAGQVSLAQNTPGGCVRENPGGPPGQP